ncbi:nitrogen fixation protein NifM [Pantoea phytobeneficialis]|uniref:peptidylprolyl isomerase n=1 Tax=Pantoea phytobeneficialis TaxID=2052056 RepID=A0AAP9HAH6_9GAMM|nr:nitrogen fixation protein NifM [Pantoea phytobeneficialis]MDO6406660.1 nitrogen fixation protein NifM [Pantoea phytobeneficialis]QGR09750.1 nitrogen fixation protein NifM [Pantoea phytobeneficialis]
MPELWERFSRQQLAQSRWQCSPEALSVSQQAEFHRLWQRQRKMECALAGAAGNDPIPEKHLISVTTSLSPLLAEQVFSDAERTSIIQHHARMEIQLARVAEQAPAPDELQVLAWYRQHQDKFMRPEQRLCWHLLLTTDNDRPAMYHQIQQLRQQIITSRQHFNSLAQRWSHCPSALEGGRMGWISRGLLFPELESVLFAMKPNGVSHPIETQLGWHLLWCEMIRPPAPMEQNAALTQVRTILTRQNQQQWLRQWLKLPGCNGG